MNALEFRPLHDPLPRDNALVARSLLRGSHLDTEFPQIRGKRNISVNTLPLRLSPQVPLVYVPEQQARGDRALPQRESDSFIGELPAVLSERYKLLRPIPVKLTRTGSESHVAHFRAADVSMTGHSVSDAKEELAATIVDFMEVFKDDPDFQQEIAAIAEHIRVRNAEET